MIKVTLGIVIGLFLSEASSLYYLHELNKWANAHPHDLSAPTSATMCIAEVLRRPLEGIVYGGCR